MRGCLWIQRDVADFMGGEDLATFRQVACQLREGACRGGLCCGVVGEEVYARGFWGACWKGTGEEVGEKGWVERVESGWDKERG